MSRKTVAFCLLFLYTGLVGLALILRSKELGGAALVVLGIGWLLFPRQLDIPSHHALPESDRPRWAILRVFGALSLAVGIFLLVR